MKIKSRLLLALLITILIVLIVSYASLQTNRSLHHSYQQLSDETLPLIATLQELRYLTQKLIADTAHGELLRLLPPQEPIATPSQEAQSASPLAQLERQRTITIDTEQLKESLLHYQQLVSLYFPDEAEYAQLLDEQSSKLLTITQQVIGAEGHRLSSHQRLSFQLQMEQLAQGIFSLSDEAMEHEREEVTERSEAIATSIEQHLHVIIVGTLLIIALAMLMARLNSRYIVTPLQNLTAASGRIARGEVGVTVSAASTDEIGTLTSAFNHMAHHLEAHKNQLKAAHRFTENILQAMDDMVIATDRQGVILKVNRATCVQLDYTEQVLLGSPINTLFADEQSSSALEYLAPQRERQIEHLMLHRNGQPIPVLTTLDRIQDPASDFNGYLLIATNISARKVAEDRIHKLAFYDTLTGLPNRTLFIDRLNQSIKQAKRFGFNLAVMFLDLDNFKQVNDTMGHAVGDKLLRTVSERLIAVLRDSDVVSAADDEGFAPTLSRHGGDEFLILLPSVTDPLDAAKVADRIQHALTTSILINMHEIFTTLSIGIAIYPMDGNDSHQLIQNADTALYSSKDGGKNGYAFFEEEMNINAMRRLDIENSLRKALIRQEFQLYYQPQLCLTTGKTIGMEALVRWNHPEWGLVSPLAFIQVAENTGLIIPLGEWVLTEACQQWARWHQQGYQPGKMSVNLSAVQFRDEALGDKIRAIITQSAIPPAQLVLEVTESVLMHDAEDTLLQLQSLKAIGVRFAVDDFGTGYSSLSYLKTFPLDYLKIDRSFIRDLSSNPSDLEIVRTIISMAKSLGLELIAEGVETQEILQLLQQQSCDYMQGFLLSRPIPAYEYETAFLGHLAEQHSGLSLCRNALQQ